MGICVLNFKNGTKGTSYSNAYYVYNSSFYIVVIELFYWNNKFVNEIIPTTSTNLINYLHFLSIVKICSFIQLGCQIVQALLAIYSN
ncbi:hypothetical protein Mgra_00005205 [Meloidogyne graminicola]|uniref:Uncharacterized protein n=1 Tax=Meloidogyne graminicola TaxID=189291 RepID=A0A8S9ZQ42_9BILA|nr:hypothetical protein Mgra_00005205 [Meloidogyne graminicola]